MLNAIRQQSQVMVHSLKMAHAKPSNWLNETISMFAKNTIISELKHGAYLTPKLLFMKNGAHYVQPNSNLPGGVINQSVTHNYSDQLWFDTRDQLIQYARNIIIMRENLGKLKKEHGVSLLLYGISFTYDAGKEDYVAIVVDLFKFFEHLVGLMKTKAEMNELEQDLLFKLADLSNMPILYGVQVDAKGRKVVRV